MGIKRKLALLGLGGAAVLGTAGVVGAAKKAGTLNLPGSPSMTSAQYLKQRGYFNDPRVVARRRLMKIGSLKERIKGELQKRGFTGPTAPSSASTLSSLVANTRQTVASSPALGAQVKMTMAQNAVPGSPVNTGFGKPTSHIEGAPGAAGIQKAASDPLKGALEKRAFLGAVGGFLARKGTGFLGKVAIGGGAAALTGGDPLTGALLGGFMPGMTSAGAVGAAGGLLTQSRKFRNVQMGLPGEQEAMMLGQINPEQYNPSASLPMSGLTSLWSPA